MKIFSNIPTGITYDDVLLVPKRSPVSSRANVDLSTNLTAKIKLHFPIIPANMDTITESQMAVAMAREGSIGIIHRFQSVDNEVGQVKAVKRIEDLILHQPLILSPSHLLSDVLFQVDRYNTTSFLIIDSQNKLVGILSQRDYRFTSDLNTPVSKMMTPFEKMVCASHATSIGEAKRILEKNRLEKLPLINPDRTLYGLYTAKDILYFESKPKALRNRDNQLMVGASIGATGDYIERAIELDRAGVDLLLIDVAHGHADHILTAIKVIRKKFPKQQIIAGNIATAQAARDLIKAGADAIKVGIGPGSVCTTRIIAGVGVPQLSAIYEVAKVCSKTKTPLIADGGTKNSGDVVKALAAGASVVMSGNMFAGTDETPGEIVKFNQKSYKFYHGSSTYTVAVSRNQKGDFGKLAKHQTTRVEGAEGLVLHKGPVAKVIDQLTGGISSGLSYCGAHNIKQLRKNAEFILVTANGIRENSHHDVIV